MARTVDHLGLPAEMEGAAPTDQFIAGGLASLGIEADEVDLAVMAAVHRLIWPPLRELLALDTEGIEPEGCPDLSKAPR
jgi:hypothetical protein